ncbi:hypothetical protein GCM10027299_00110 [Larkinella ripae]
MKTYLQLVAKFLIVSCVAVSACQSLEGPEGPQGPQGPAGPAGAAGTTGATGPKGADGTANAQQINYTSRSHDGLNDLLLALPQAINRDVVEKSMFYVYVKQSARGANNLEEPYWFSIPGETIKGNGYTHFVSPGGGQTLAGLFLRRTVNFQAGSEYFEAVRVVVVSANNVINGRKAAIDYSKYEEVRKAYGWAD